MSVGLTLGGAADLLRDYSPAGARLPPLFRPAGLVPGFMPDLGGQFEKAGYRALGDCPSVIPGPAEKPALCYSVTGYELGPRRA